jgi:hypothetical protein
MGGNMNYGGMNNGGMGGRGYWIFASIVLSAIVWCIRGAASAVALDIHIESNSWSSVCLFFFEIKRNIQNSQRKNRRPGKVLTMLPQRLNTWFLGVFLQ